MIIAISGASGFSLGKKCYKLIPKIPKNKIIVAESGLYSHEQLVKLNQAGVDAFLIGEHFMRQENIPQAIKEIKKKNR